VLYCVRGQIVFCTAGGGIELGPGDKMVLPPHAAHAATAGSGGVRCIEADPDDPWVESAATQTPQLAPDPIRNREAPGYRRA